MAMGICKQVQLHKIHMDISTYFLFIHTVLIFDSEYGIVALEILFLLKKKKQKGRQPVKHDIRISSLFSFVLFCSPKFQRIISSSQNMLLTMPGLIQFGVPWDL